MALTDAKPYNNLLTVKPVISDHSKVAKTKVLMTNDSLMKLERIAECSHSVILLPCSDNWS